MRSAALSLLLLAIASSASAQDFSAQRLHLAPDATSGFFVVQRGRTAGAGAANVSLAFDYANDPLVLESTAGIEPGYSPVSGKLLTDQSTLHAMFALGPTSWLELGAEVALIVAQQGERLAGLPDPNAIDGSAGLGPIRLVPRAMLINTAKPDTDYPIALSVGIDATLPTGSGERLQGGQTELAPIASVELGTPDALVLAGNFGYAFRPDERELLGVRADSEILWGVGVSMPIVSVLRASAEVTQNLATEALFSTLLNMSGFLAAAGVGIGLDDDALTPDYRLLVRIGFEASRSSSVVWRDTDDDAVPDWQDECPTEKEDHDGFSDDDGCPDTVREYIESMPVR
jgi:hypothetical protein